MSTIDEQALTKASGLYVSGVFSAKFDQFLNTTYSGFAQESSGTEVSILFKALFTALCLCTFQLTLFCLFRPILKELYQPRCHFVPLCERIEPLPQGHLSWIFPTINTSTKFYLTMGLDTYFFVRFLSIQLFYFFSVGLLNMLILLPINWSGSSSKYSALGIDKLSVSNIANTKAWRLNAHFIMSLITIGCFHLLLIYELDNFVKIRQSYLMSPIHKNSIVARTILISNVPPDLRNVDAFIEVFSSLPGGGVKSVWLSYKFDQMRLLVSQAEDALKFLETSHINYLKKSIRKQLFDTQISVFFSPRTNKLAQLMSDQSEEKLNYDIKVSPKFHPPIYLKPFRVPCLDRTFLFKLPGFLRAFRFESKQYMAEWAIVKLSEIHSRIEQEKFLLNNSALKTHDKVFVEFHCQESASIALQCLLSKKQGTMNQCAIEVNPNDILWDNIARRNSIFAFLENYIACIIFICITILYIIPVSFIGLISQIPLIIHLLPFLKWINSFPEDIRNTFSKLFPSILLAVLTGVVMVTFRFLSYFKGKQTGAQREADLQSWYFAFLFIQQFLVITISSSLTFIFKQIVDQPTSIPVLLALHLPKAGTFFLEYLSIRALAVCGNNFLRFDQLILNLTFHRIFDKTPRETFKRLTNLMKIKWGTIYPVYSIYCSIGLVYTIISPMISVILILLLSLALLYYKYALKFVYSQVNDSETHGMLYPVALLQLYSGIYCLEACMIGMFFLSRDADGNRPLRIQGYLMFVILLLTICGNINIYKRNSKHFRYTPIIPDVSRNSHNNMSSGMTNTDSVGEINDEDKKNEILDEHYSNKKLLYLHPDFKYEIPPLWLPEDPLGISDSQIKYVQEIAPCLPGGKIKGATLDFNRPYLFFRTRVSDAPPGYK